MQKRVYIVNTSCPHLSAIPAAVTSKLKQRLIDTRASMSQNLIDEAVGHISIEKAVTCKQEAKGRHFEHLLN